MSPPHAAIKTRSANNISGDLATNGDVEIPGVIEDLAIGHSE